MNTKSLGVCLIVILSGCASSHLRASAPAGDAGRERAFARVANLDADAGRPASRCAALDLNSFAALRRFSQVSLWEVWEELARAGVTATPPLFAIDAALLPSGRGRQSAIVATPFVCAGMHPEQPGFAILLLPMLPELRDRRAHPTADLLLPDAPSAQDVRFWARVDPERLLRKLPDAGASLGPEQGRRRLLIPLDGGSLLRVAPPGYGAQSGVLLEGPESEPILLHQSNASVGASVPDDLFDYRFRLPTGTARILIVHF